MPQDCCSSNLSLKSSQAISSDRGRGGGGRGGHRVGHDSGGRTRNSAVAALCCALFGHVIDTSRAISYILTLPIYVSDYLIVGDEVIVTAPGKTCEESGDFIAISIVSSGAVECSKAGICDRTGTPDSGDAALFAAATALQSAHEDSRQGDSHPDHTHCRGLHTEPISGQWGE
eukprot:s293_g13.t1